MRLLTGALALSLIALAPAAVAQPSLYELASLPGEFAEATPVSAPMSLTDGLGQLWDIQYDGTVADGTSDTFDGAMTLQVDGNFGSYGGMLVMFEDGRTLGVPTAQIGRLLVTRMIHVSPDDGFARWVDVLDNPGGEAVTARVVYTLAMGSDGDTHLVSTTDGDAVLTADDRGWVSDDADEAGGDAAFGLLYGDTGGVSAPAAQLLNGNDMPTVSFTVEVPANGSTALVMVLTQRVTAADASAWLADADPRALAGDVEVPVANFSGVGGGPTFRVRGLLRGGDRDVVELRNGDRLEGTVLDKSWTVSAAHGEIEVELKDVAGLIAGEPGWGTDAVVLLRGEVLVGHLTGDPVTLQLPMGRKLTLPAERIARVGMRKRGDAEETFQATADTAFLVRGDRLQGQIETQAFGIATPYGTVGVDRGKVAGIDFDAEGGRLHRIRLADGSTLSGIVTEPMVVFRHHDGQELSLATSQLAALEVPGLLIEPTIDPGAPVVTLANGDTWYARPVTATLPIASGVGGMDLSLDEIHTLRVVEPSTGEVVVELVDGGTLSGRLATDAVSFRMVCGIDVLVPVSELRAIAVPNERQARASGNLGPLPIRLGG